jgi:hypothetical protein
VLDRSLNLQLCVRGTPLVAPCAQLLVAANPLVRAAAARRGRLSAGSPQVHEHKVGATAQAKARDKLNVVCLQAYGFRPVPQPVYQA